MNTIDYILNDNKAQFFVVLILILYISVAKPKIPKSIQTLFDNSYFKIGFLGFIAYRANYEPLMAIFMAIAYVVTLNCFMLDKMIENFEKDNCTIQKDGVRSALMEMIKKENANRLLDKTQKQLRDDRNYRALLFCR